MPSGLRAVARSWMAAKVRALSALMRRIEAGEPLASPVGVSRRTAVGGAGAPAARTPGSPEDRLPRCFGWMCAFGPNVRRDGMAFAELLNQPAIKAKVLAAPERMARLIGPMLTATGERRPDWFPVVARSTRGAPAVPVPAVTVPVDDSAGAGVDGAGDAGCAVPGYVLRWPGSACRACRRAGRRAASNGMVRPLPSRGRPRRQGHSQNRDELVDGYARLYCYDIVTKFPPPMAPCTRVRLTMTAHSVVAQFDRGREPVRRNDPCRRAAPDRQAATRRRTMAGQVRRCPVVGSAMIVDGTVQGADRSALICLKALR